MALSKTGRFLSKAEILGVGVFSPLSSRQNVGHGERCFPQHAQIFGENISEPREFVDKKRLHGATPNAFA